MPTARKLTPEECEKFDDTTRRERQRRRIEQIKLRYDVLHEPWRFIPCLMEGIDSGTVLNDANTNSDGNVPPIPAEASTCSTISSQEKSESSVHSMSLHENEFQVNTSNSIYPITSAQTAITCQAEANTSEKEMVLSQKILYALQQTKQDESQEKSVAKETNPAHLTFVPQEINRNHEGNSIALQQLVESQGIPLQASNNSAGSIEHEDSNQIERLNNGKKYESHDADALEKLLLESETETDEGQVNESQVFTTKSFVDCKRNVLHDAGTSSKEVSPPIGQNVQESGEVSKSLKNTTVYQCLPSHDLRESDVEKARIWNFEDKDTAEILKQLINNT